MADRLQHFESLGQTIARTAERRAREDSDACCPREIAYTAHPNALALSWQVGLDYLRACTYQTSRAQVLKGKTAAQEPPALNEGEENRLAAQSRARFSGLSDRPMRVDCYIFFKDGSDAPDINEGMRHAFLRAFHGAPLHTHFAIWRMQRPNPATGTLEFSEWCAYERAFPPMEEVHDVFFEAVSFGRCPAEPSAAEPSRETRSARGWRRWIGVVVAVWLIGVAVLALAGYAMWSGGMPLDRWGLGGYGSGAQDRLREDAAVLNREYRGELAYYYDYQRERARLVEEDAPPREIAQLDRAIALSRDRLDALARLLGEAGLELARYPAHHPLPDCWQVGAGGGPAHLFEARMNAGALRLDYASPGARMRAMQEGLPVHDLDLDRVWRRNGLIEFGTPFLAVGESRTPACRYTIRFDQNGYVPRDDGAVTALEAQFNVDWR
ncbi:hypothetical protein [Marinicauda sp. Alg238-R41]|uniref:hypothetical protein n=1 Tax=Marinicauda sp. Alg238-R41 TaxID=2993447 RepID=UPI0022E5E93B|nr:hypothetical protein [Marinicauda sp. Alg238-R41]